MVRRAGLEPAPPAWEAGILPLDHRRSLTSIHILLLVYRVSLGFFKLFFGVMRRKFWWGRAESNRRPPGRKPGVLPLDHGPMMNSFLL